MGKDSVTETKVDVSDANLAQVIFVEEVCGSCGGSADRRDAVESGNVAGDSSEG